MVLTAPPVSEPGSSTQSSSLKSTTQLTSVAPSKAPALMVVGICTKTVSEPLLRTRTRSSSE